MSGQGPHTSTFGSVTDTTWVALLRGINVGGNRKVPMAQLREVLESAGYTEVTTLLQSGNVVFQSPAPVSRHDLGIALETLLTSAFGFDLPIALRTGTEMAQIVRRYPFPGADAEPKLHHVMFLRDQPSPDKLASLPLDRSPGTDLIVQESEIAVRYGEGVATSTVTNTWLDRQLDTMTTARNWNTVNKLVELANVRRQ